MTRQAKKITATKVKNLNGFTGEAALYKLSSPVKYEEIEGKSETDHIVVSATGAMPSGAETYIFPANESGEITSWLEMDGSLRGTLNHEDALRSAGFEVLA